MLVLITWPASVTGAGEEQPDLGGSLVLMDPCIELRTLLICLMFPSLYYAHFGWTLSFLSKVLFIFTKKVVYKQVFPDLNDTMRIETETSLALDI